MSDEIPEPPKYEDPFADSSPVSRNGVQEGGFTMGCGSLIAFFPLIIVILSTVPGWGSNWSQVADSIEVQMQDASAVVLMPWVRTNFGKRIRKDCSANHVPWVPCTSRGIVSSLRSIEYAVNLANSHKQ